MPLNDEDAIILEDSRVTPEGFRGIYLQVRDANVTTWFPFDYLMASSAAWTAEGELPAVILLRGGLILDPKRSLLALSLVLQIMSDGGDVDWPSCWRSMSDRRGPPGEASGPRSLSTVSASLVTTAERVVITKDGEAADQLVGCEGKRRGFDWDRLNDIRRELGIEDASPEEVAAWKADFEDAAFSRRVLGLE